MKISNTPHSSITYAGEICGNLLYKWFNGFLIIPHSNKWIDDRLIDIGVRFSCTFEFLATSLRDILERFLIERSAELDDDFARKFWTDSARLREALWFAAGDCLHHFILSEFEQGNSSFWTKPIYREEFWKYSLLFKCIKSDKPRSCFCLVMIDPEFQCIARAFCSDSLSLHSHGISYPSDEKSDVVAFDKFQCSDKERNHGISIWKSRKSK